MDLTERACRLLATMEPSVSGSNGHDKLFAAAAALVVGFDFDDASAKSLLVSQFNPRCNPPWNDREIDHKINQVKTHCKEPRGYLLGRGRDQSSSSSHQNSASSIPAASPAPTPERVKKRQEFEPSALQKMMMRGFNPDTAWLAERSPWDPRRITPQAFLDAIFQPGEKTILFIRYASQGQFGHIAGSPGKTYYVADRPGLKPTICEEFPKHAREGAWFLPSPVDGKWHPNGNVDEHGNPVLSRRTGHSITCYRHLLLESDDAPEADWLNLICQLPLPISALYTSGSRSIHALVRIDAKSKSEFDAFRDRVSPILSKLGADPAAISGVRLTRLPGVIRDGTTDKDGRYHKFDPPRLQRLLYLNPHPELTPIRLLPRLRKIQPE
jgi:hypothetical protein